MTNTFVTPTTELSLSRHIYGYKILERFHIETDQIIMKHESYFNYLAIMKKYNRNSHVSRPHFVLLVVYQHQSDYE